jgi:hypothetical protein
MRADTGLGRSHSTSNGRPASSRAPLGPAPRTRHLPPACVKPIHHREELLDVAVEPAEDHHRAPRSSGREPVRRHPRSSIGDAVTVTVRHGPASQDKVDEPRPQRHLVRIVAANEEPGRPHVKCGPEKVALAVRSVGQAQEQAPIRFVVRELRSDPADVGQRASPGPGDPSVELEVDRWVRVKPVGAGDQPSGRTR